MIKQCVICHKDFEPYYAKAKTQKTCSKECRYVYQMNYRSFMQETSESFVEKRRKRNKFRYESNRKPVLCSICGEPAEYGITGRRPKMHDECVLNQCIEEYRKTGKLTHTQELRLYSRGYTKNEFLEEYELRKSDKPIDWNKEICSGLLNLEG